MKVTVMRYSPQEHLKMAQDLTFLAKKVGNPGTKKKLLVQAAKARGLARLAAKSQAMKSDTTSELNRKPSPSMKPSTYVASEMLTPSEQESFRQDMKEAERSDCQSAWLILE